jgi:hypothetical protein
MAPIQRQLSSSVASVTVRTYASNNQRQSYTSDWQNYPSRNNSCSSTQVPAASSWFKCTFGKVMVKEGPRGLWTRWQDSHGRHLHLADLAGEIVAEIVRHSSMALSNVLAGLAQDGAWNWVPLAMPSRTGRRKMMGITFVIFMAHTTLRRAV